jgi:hypothetical protein
VANEIVAALEQAAKRIGKTLSEDAAKAVQKMYSGAGNGVKQVVQDITKLDKDHADKLLKITEDIGKGDATKAAGKDLNNAADRFEARTKIAKLLNPDKVGVVRVKVPKGASPEEVKQFERYAEGSNRAVSADALSKTGRVQSTKNDVRKEAKKAAYAENKRAEAAGKPYQGVAGHVPDAAWMGKGEPHEWQDMSKHVNSSLAGQINGYPAGYIPTKFEVEHPE